MKKIIFILSLLMASAAWAQSGGSDPGTSASQGSTATGQEQTTDETDTKPAESPRSIFGEAFGRKDVRAELTFSQEYDDNVLSSSLIRRSDNISRFSGRLSLSAVAARHSWELHYVPDYRLYARFDSRNGLSQNLAHRLDVALGPHTNFHWDSTLSDTSTNANSRFSFATVNGVPVPVFNPNALENGVRVFSTNTNFGLNHRISARTTLYGGFGGATANFFELDGVAPATGRSNEHYSVNANIGGNYAVTKAVRIGVQATGEYYGFLSPANHQNYQSLHFTYEQRFRNGLVLNLGAGPGFRESGGNVDLNHDLNLGASKTIGKAFVNVQYKHGRQLGYTQGGIGSDQLAFYVNRQFMRRWDAGGSFSFSRTESLTTGGKLDSYGTSGSLGYRITRDLRLSASYSYLNQSSGSAALSSNTYDRNTFRITLSYVLPALFHE